MPDTATVKDALSRLAREPPGTPSTESCWLGADDYRDVVATAEDAVESVDAAADFLDGDGIDRLDAAIESAEAAGDHAAARRGRRARETLTDFRAAARGDQFHSGHGTALGGGAQGGRNDTGNTYG